MKRRYAAVASIAFALTALVGTMTPAGAALNAPSLGVSVSTAESTLLTIYGSGDLHLATDSAVRGIPRVDGQDSSADTDVEVYGSKNAVGVELVVFLGSSDKNLVELQVVSAVSVCGAIANESAETWCQNRILDTDKSGLKTASTDKRFGPAWIRVNTYRSSSTRPPFFAVVIAGSKAALGVL